MAEQYNDAKYQLSLIERKLAEARSQRQAAERKARAAEDRLAERAVQAYVGTGSQVDGLLGAESIAEFSDRLVFMGAVAEGDAEIARQATNAAAGGGVGGLEVRRHARRAAAAGRLHRRASWIGSTR